MNTVKLSIVIQSHLSDMLLENEMGRTDMVSHRIRFIKELLFQYRTQPLNDVQIDEVELDKLWTMLYRGVEV
jgi:hypothetical protein